MRALLTLIALTLMLSVIVGSAAMVTADRMACRSVDAAYNYRPGF